MATQHQWQGLSAHFHQPRTTQRLPQGLFPMLFRFKISQKKPVYNLTCFSGLFPLELYLGLKYFQTITRCKFHNKPHAIKELIDRYVFSHISRLYRQRLTLHSQSGFIGFFDAP